MYNKKNMICFWIIFTCQILIILILPYFLFYNMDGEPGITWSYYIPYDGIWAYFMFMFIGSFIGLIFNSISLGVQNPGFYLARAIINIIGNLPTLILSILTVWLLDFYFPPNIVQEMRFVRDCENLRTAGFIGLFIMSWLSIGQWLLQFLFSFAFKEFHFDFGFILSKTQGQKLLAVFLSLCILILILSSIGFYYQNDIYDLVVAVLVFPIFMAVILGPIFATLIVVSIYSKKFNYIYYSGKSKMNIKIVS